MSYKKPDYSEDALDQETTTLSEGLGSTCVICGKHVDHEGCVESCMEPDCPNDVLGYYELRYDDELNFHED